MRTFRSSTAKTTERLASALASGLVLGVSVGTESLRAGLLDLNGWLHAPRNSLRGRDSLRTLRNDC